MIIILSAFGDKPRSMPMSVPHETGDVYHMMVDPPAPKSWEYGEITVARKATFRFRGKIEYREDSRWMAPGYRIYELEMPE